MGFESGAIGLRMFYPRGRLPVDCVDRFAENAAPPISSLGKDEINGWVTSRHLLDRNITEDSAYVAGYLHLVLMKADRKIPEALLRAECRMEELAEMAANNLNFLKRKVKQEIKKSVVDRLLPQMPPTLTGISMVYDSREHLVYATALSEKQLDAFVIAFQRATGIPLEPVTPEVAAIKRKGINPRDLAPVTFAPELAEEFGGEALGRDFLTWLWFYSEARGGILNLEHETWGVMLEGPLTFVLEGDGAHVTVLRRGSPLVSSEAKTALMSGKKLKSAKLTLARGDEMWTCTLDADEFVLRGLKLPKGQELDAASRFQERMLALATFQNILMAFYDRFLEERAFTDSWQKVRGDIHKWVTERPNRL
jgi:hypothetical protein